MTKPSYEELICAHCGEPIRLTHDGKVVPCAAANSDLARVRGLLQRAKEGWMDSIDYHHELGEAWGGNSVYPDKENCEENHSCIGKADQDGIVDCVAMRVKVIDADELDKLLAPNFSQSSSLVSPGAESADIGKLDTADKSGKVNRVDEKERAEFQPCLTCDSPLRCMRSESCSDDTI